MVSNEDMDQVEGNITAMDLESAIADAINIYLREVLGPHGVIDSQADEAYPDCAGSERNAMKYAVARRVALCYLGKVPDLDFRASTPWIRE